MKIYLAGPITGCSWEEATEWRNWITKKLKRNGIECYSPLRFKAEAVRDFSAKLPDSNEEFPLTTSKGITTRDRWDAMRSDVVIVNFLGAKKVSIGTVMEIAWADAHRIPVIVIMEPDNIHNHSMIHESVGFIVRTLEEAVVVARALLMVEGE